MKNILVIGGSGFVGRNLKEHFEALGDAYAVDAPSHAELDVLDEEQVRRAVAAKPYDAVLNCLDLPALTANYLEDRLRGFANLANSAGDYGRMIYFGTGAEYARHLPICRVGEDAVGRAVPRDTYGLCMSCENAAARASDNIINLRLFGIFGKYERWQTRFISNAICKALFGYPITVRQDRVMDYLHVDDLCRITQWAVDGRPRHRDYNATSGRAYSLVGLAQLVKERLGTDVPVYVAKEGFGPEYTSKNGRLRAEFADFDAEPMADSIDKLAAYYRAHRDLISREALLYQ